MPCGSGAAGLYHATYRQTGGDIRYRWCADGNGRRRHAAPSPARALAGLAGAKRTRQPLNGLILTLDLPDLLIADKRRHEQLVQMLRSRLQEVRQSLHTRLPVYIVLTKLDLLTGFAAWFRALDRRDRDRIPA